jgi:hypothetical protein
MSCDEHRDDEQAAAVVGLDPETYAKFEKALSIVCDHTQAALEAAIAGVTSGEPRLAGRELDLAGSALATVISRHAVETAIAIAPGYGVSALDALGTIVRTIMRSVADASGQTLALREIKAARGAASGDDAQSEEARHVVH